MQQEWPWLGVGFYWFFKQADEREKDSNPQYYFRMVEPDFTPLPVYHAIQAQTRQTPILYSGWHQANHWAINYQGHWRPNHHQAATFGDILTGQPGDTVTFTFEGHRLDLVTIGTGKLQVQIDHGEPVKIDLSDESIPSTVNIVNTLSPGPHQIRLAVIAGPMSIDGYVVESRSGMFLAGSVILILAILGGGAWFVLKRWQKNRKK
jgi:hypothetical protein